MLYIIAAGAGPMGREAGPSEGSMAGQLRPHNPAGKDQPARSKCGRSPRQSPDDLRVTAHAGIVRAPHPPAPEQYGFGKR